MNILLVDSSMLYKGILQQALAPYGDVRIDQVTSLAQARQMLEDREFGFFVISGQLEDGSGLAFARELRQSGQAKVEPIVVLTSSASANMAAEALESGVTELFRKQDLDELLRFMRHYVEIHQPMYCRVLYVEDANDQRAVLAAQMREWGMTVEAFSSADEAWKAFDAGQYDLVLCDVVLGGQMTGSRLINRIRRSPLPRGATPLLAVTAFDHPARRVELFQLGVDDYVLKPIVEEELRARVHNLLSRKRAVERNQLLLSATALGVVTLDPLGHVDSLDANARAIFRAEEQAMIGLPLHTLFSDLGEAGAAKILETLDSGASQPKQRLHVLRQDGTTAPVEVTALEIMGETDYRQFAFLLRDIEHECTLAENLLKARVAAESAERMKAEFMANMSHEIRTPLNAIIGMAYLLQRAPLPEAYLSHVRRINNAGHQLLELVDSVLDLSKIGSGKLQLDARPVNVQEILNEVAGLIGGRAREKGLLVRVEPCQVPSGLVGDPLRLRQALLNYANNAVKFTERGECILRASVAARFTYGVMLQFEVEDTGIGISTEILQNLFAPFLQGDGSPTRQHGGTGIGLAITRELAELMGGQVGVSSEPGQGSRFWFTAMLEFAQTKLESLHSTPNILPAGQLEEILRAEFEGVRVLLVEDDRANREVGVALLKDVGLVVDTAGDGLEAIEKARQQRYALILMDILMPKLDGIQATREILQLPGGGDVPIVALTANALAEEKARCLEAGMKDFVTKPIHTEHLFSVLLRWLRRD